MSEVISPVGAGSVLAERYEVVGHLARGGMGEVFEGEDRRLDRRVAIKVFHAATGGDRTRFHAEALTLAALNHPGLVQVYDAGEHGRDSFLVLELVPGPTLAERSAADGPMVPTEVTELVAPIADALAYVHANGVVHRDVTPSNILCAADGRPRLADFGIARLIDTTRVTAAATALGTAAYMAPEQVQGVDVTPAADVYALGLVALELLTGSPGFDGPSHEVAMAWLARGPRIPSSVPGAWRSLIEDMTARTITDRPTAAAVRDRLESMDRHRSETTGAVPAQGLAGGYDITEVSVRAPATEVLPVPLEGTASPRRWHRGRVVWTAVVGLVLVVLISAALAGGGGDAGVEPTSTTTSVPAAAAPPATESPTVTASDPSDAGDAGAKSPGKEKGKGDGKGKGTTKH